MRQFDFAPLLRTAIGFDRLANLLENAVPFEGAENYPPYNIEKTGDQSYRVTMAVAGFTRDDLSVEQERNVLIISAHKENEGETQYLYRGIAKRAFQRRFQLADFVKVVGANLTDGLLSVELVREVPEEMKPRRVQIAGVKAIDGDPQKQLEQKAA